MTEPDPFPRKPANLAPLWVSGLAAVFVLATRDLEIDFEALVWGVGDMVEYIGRFGAPR